MEKGKAVCLFCELRLRLRLIAPDHYQSSKKQIYNEIRYL